MQTSNYKNECCPSPWTGKFTKQTGLLNSFDLYNVCPGSLGGWSHYFSRRDGFWSKGKREQWVRGNLWVFTVLQTCGSAQLGLFAGMRWRTAEGKELCGMLLKAIRNKSQTLGMGKEQLSGCLSKLDPLCYIPDIQSFCLFINRTSPHNITYF